MSGKSKSRQKLKYVKKPLTTVVKPKQVAVGSSDIWPNLESGVGLLPDLSNVQPWWKSLCKTAETKFGFTGKCFRLKGYPEREPRDAEGWERWQEIADADDELLAREKAKYATGFLLQEQQDLADHPKLFALMECTLPDNVLKKLETIDAYVNARDAEDPVEGMRLVRQKILMGMEGLSERERKVVRLTDLFTCTQGANETLDKFLDNIERIRDDLEEMAHPQLPSMEDTITIVLQNVRNRRDMEWANWLRQKERQEEVIPTTFDALRDSRGAFVPSASDGYLHQSIGHAVYDTHVEEKERGACHYCGLHGHFIAQCRKRLADEARAGSDSGSDDGDAKAEPATKPEKKKAKPKQTVAKAGKAGGAGKKKKVTAHSLQVNVFGSAIVADDSLIWVDSLSDHNFHCSEEVVTGAHSYPFSVACGAGNFEMKDGVRGQMGCLGPSVYMPKGGRNGVAECNLHGLEPKCVIGKYWRITTPAGYVFFNWREGQKGYAMRVTAENMAKLRSAEPRGGNTASVHGYATTVKEREALFTKAEVKRAQRARQLQRVLNFPGAGALAMSLNKSAWTNMTVKAADVRLADEIYGAETCSRQGKAREPRNSRAELTRVPEDRHTRGEQKMYTDVFFWHEKPFLICVLKPLCLVITRNIPKKAMTVEGYRAALEWTIDHVERRGFTIEEILVDADKLLGPLVEDFPNLTAAEAGAKVGDVEVEIRVLEEMMRSTEAAIPVPVLLRHIEWLVRRVTVMRNRVIRVGMAVSPNEAFSLRKDSEKDLEGEFYDYCQAYRKPERKNGHEIRTVAALKLLPMFNGRGGYYYYDLVSEAVFTGTRTASLPMPELAIQKIIQIWKREVPERKRAMRAAWKLGRLGANYQHPVAGNELEDYRLLLEHAPPIAQRREVDQAPGLPELLEEQEPIEDAEEPGEPAGRDQPQEPAAGALDDRDDGVDDWTGQPIPVANIGNMSQGTDEELDPSEREELDDLVARAGMGVEMAASRHAVRKSARLASKQADLRQYRLYRLSLRKALKLNKRSTRQAVMSELQQMLDLKVWAYLQQTDLSKKQMKAVIRSLMFLKEKRDAEGIFIKMKARLVAGGDRQDKNLYENLSSPTVSLESVMAIIAIAAIERRKIFTVDITGAYLECELPEGDEVIMELDPMVTVLLQELDPDAKQYQTVKGTTLVKLQRALYGCVQSSRLWYERLRGALEGIGFVVNPYDQCVFNTVIDGVQVTVAFHVDDLLLTSESKAALEKVIAGLKEEFVAVTVNREPKHSYLAMNIEASDEDITIDMSGYLEKLLAGRKLRRAHSPASGGLCTDDPDSPALSDKEREDFHSDVAKILFFAKRVGLQCMTAVSVLASKVNAPTVVDQRRLDRVFGYLDGNRDMKLRFKRGGTVDLKCYVDASWATHDDGHGRTGIVLMMAGCAVAAWSFKQKMVTRSSTEAEIVALSDGLTQLLWMRYLLTSQGYDLPPTTVFQDNSAVMALMKGPRGTHQRTKHLDVRYFYARDLERDGVIKMEWLATKHMIADLLTKPLQGTLFDTLKKQLMGH